MPRRGAQQRDFPEQDQRSLPVNRIGIRVVRAPDRTGVLRDTLARSGRVSVRRAGGGTGRRVGGLRRCQQGRRWHGAGLSPGDARLLHDGRCTPGPHRVRGQSGQGAAGCRSGAGSVGTGPAHKLSRGVDDAGRSGFRGAGADRATRPARSPTGGRAPAPPGRGRRRGGLGRDAGSRRVLPQGQTCPCPRRLGLRARAGPTPHPRVDAGSTGTPPRRGRLDQRGRPALGTGQPAGRSPRHPGPPPGDPSVATTVTRRHRATRTGPSIRRGRRRC